MRALEGPRGDPRGGQQRHPGPPFHAVLARAARGADVGRARSRPTSSRPFVGARYLRALPMLAAWAWLLAVAGLGSWALFCACGAGRRRGARAGARGRGCARRLPAVPASTGCCRWPSRRSRCSAAYLMTLGLRLTREERERARTRSLFGRYVSEAVVEMLLSQTERPDLGGEAATVTVLFSDIRNFTTIAEKLSAHEVVEMLNAYFGARLRADPGAGRQRRQVHRRCGHGGVRLAGRVPRSCAARGARGARHGGRGGRVPRLDASALR